MPWMSIDGLRLMQSPRCRSAADLGGHGHRRVMRVELFYHRGDVVDGGPDRPGRPPDLEAFHLVADAPQQQGRMVTPVLNDHSLRARCLKLGLATCAGVIDNRSRGARGPSQMPTVTVSAEADAPRRESHQRAVHPPGANASWRSGSREPTPASRCHRRRESGRARRRARAASQLSVSRSSTGTASAHCWSRNLARASPAEKAGLLEA